MVWPGHWWLDGPATEGRVMGEVITYAGVVDRLAGLYALEREVTARIAVLERRKTILLDAARLPTASGKAPRAACGTDSGYYRHRRRKPTPEPACEPCKVAHSTAEAQRKQRRLVASRVVTSITGHHRPNGTAAQLAS